MQEVSKRKRKRVKRSEQTVSEEAEIRVLEEEDNDLIARHARLC